MISSFFDFALADFAAVVEVVVVVVVFGPVEEGLRAPFAIVGRDAEDVEPGECWPRLSGCGAYRGGYCG